VGAAVSAMSTINSASNKIADMIGVIDEIAFQTIWLVARLHLGRRAPEPGRLTNT